MGKDIETVPQNDSYVVGLITDLRQIIDKARNHVASTVNYELTMMYWHIGERINRDILRNERAEYGKRIVSTVVTQLQAIYGTKGFDEKNIRRMMQFAALFSDIQIVAPLARQLSWSHFLIVMPLKDELQREFYLTMAASEHWSNSFWSWAMASASSSSRSQGKTRQSSVTTKRNLYNGKEQDRI